MDPQTTLVTLVVHDSPAAVASWFDGVCDVFAEVRGSDDPWSQFRSRWPEAAAARFFTADQATRFIDGLEQLTPAPAQLLADLIVHRSELPQWYATATAAAAHDGPAATAEQPTDRFGWVSADPHCVDGVQRTFGWHPEHYDSHLGPHLDDLWGTGWEHHPPEHKHAWLTEHLATSDATDAFGWVAADATLVARIESVLSVRPEHYPDRLGPYLLQLWGTGWEQHPADHKRGWLTDHLAHARPAGDKDQQVDEALAKELAEQVVGPALAEALAAVPDIADLSAAEIYALVEEVLDTELRAASPATH
ncbi:hypothetical protein [Krasilnikovia sp. MM14-A1004]|uniref:hypothetical protein n=1 Tax=Krasilnikovia sp. MM14-A1004 TaxID=3373541 RepID=UPI00399D3161